jgi:modification methylase
MRGLPDQCVDLIVTSPPYNLRQSTGNGMRGEPGGKWSGSKLATTGYDTNSDDMPEAEYVAWQRDCLTEMMRLITPDGAIFYNHKPRVQAGLWQDRTDILDGFPVRQVIVWQRAGGVNFNPGYFLPTYEHIYLITQPEFRLAVGANRFTDIWEIPQDRSNPHPAPFPLELARRCIQSTTATSVLDPFMGSGTTGLAAVMEGRQWMGIELSALYAGQATDRIREATLGGTHPGQPSLWG